MDAHEEDDLIASIAPDVMKYLDRSQFFAKLDDILCPEDKALVQKKCAGDYKLSETILRASGFSGIDLTEILDVLKSRGACCDCEVLYNVVETSRLKAKYWQGRLKHPSREQE